MKYLDFGNDLRNISCELLIYGTHEEQIIFFLYSKGHFKISMLIKNLQTIYFPVSIISTKNSINCLTEEPSLNSLSLLLSLLTGSPLVCLKFQLLELNKFKGVCFSGSWKSIMGFIFFFFFF